MTYRVAFISGSISAKASGIKVVVECLSRELEQLGHEVRVFGEVDPAIAPNVPENWKGAGGFGFVSQGPKKFGYNRQLYDEVEKFKPDIIHLHGIWQYTSIVAMMLKKRTSAKLVISPHGSLAKAALAQSSLRKKIALALYQNRCFEKADGIHVTAHSEAEELREYRRNSEVAVIRNGVSEPTITLPRFDMRENRILALCRMEPKKGLEQLIEAWAMIENNKPDWRLEILGPNRQTYGRQLEKFAQRFSLNNLFIGDGVYDGDRDEAIASSKIFVLPSKNENFGMTVAESLSLGTPVIASRGSPWPGLRDQKCGWWVDNNVASLADALLEAIDTPTDELMAMGIRGKKMMKQHFLWNQVACEMVEFYRSLLQRKKFSPGKTG